MGRREGSLTSWSLSVWTISWPGTVISSKWEMSSVQGRMDWRFLKDLLILRMQESGRMEQIVDSWVQRRGEECGQPEISLIGTHGDVLVEYRNYSQSNYMTI